MLKNFFKLDENPKEATQTDFISIILGNDEIKDILYRPDILKPSKGHPRIKIERKSFQNVSFTKTTLKNIDFTSCHFEDCLFIGSKIINCKFRQCTFKNVNTHEIVIERTYINPENFTKNYEWTDIGKSNMAVHLFQQLLNNSRDEEQSNFARIANYNFKKWQGRLTRSKFFKKKPYPITFSEFFIEFSPNFLYRWSFGYGLRLRNFIFTFIAMFSVFYSLNLIYWKDYQLHQKDFAITSFNAEIFSHKANFFYTSDIMTQLVDSQFQPSSNFGMFMLTMQGFTGFVLFTFLITILINRFVK